MKMISELSILLENLPLTFKFWSIIQYSQSFLKQQIKYNYFDLKSCRRCLLNSVYTYNDIKNVFSRLEN